MRDSLKFIFLTLVFLFTLGQIAAHLKGGWLVGLSFFGYTFGISFLTLTVKDLLIKTKINYYLQFVLNFVLIYLLLSPYFAAFNELLKITLVLASISFFVYVDVYMVFLDFERLGFTYIVFLVPVTLFFISYIFNEESILYFLILFLPPTHYLFKTLVINKRDRSINS